MAAGFSSSQKVLLTLNNNRSAETDTSIVAYTADGHSYPLSAPPLASRESRLVDLRVLLIDAGLAGRSIGYLEITYQGIVMEVGAQLTLYPDSNASGFDSPRSLAVDFTSTQRGAAFITPVGSHAKLAFTNTSVARISALLNCDGIVEPLEIGAKATVVRDAGGPLQRLVYGKACDLTYQGDPSAIRAFGYIVNGTYAAPIRFYDPATATSKNLTAVAIDTAAVTRTIVHNTSNLPLTIHPVIRATTVTAPQTLELGAQLLLPHATALIDSDTALRSPAFSGQAFANLSVETDAPVGSLVGAITQTDTAGIVEDIPLRTSNPPAYDRGAYPLRWTGDYKNHVSIANTATESRGFRAMITAGDQTYVFPKTVLPAGTTKVFDVDALRQNGTPDIDGKVIPPDAPFGKFIWSELSNGKQTGLIGRQSLYSVSDKRKSSFSCGGTCQYIFIRIPIIFSIPDSISYGTSTPVALREFYSDVNAPSGYYQYAYLDFVAQNTPYMDSESSLTIGPVANDPYSFSLSAVGVGATNINYINIEEDSYFESPADPECTVVVTEYVTSYPTEGKPTVSIENNAFSPGGYTVYTNNSISLTADGNPANGTYAWSATPVGIVSLTPNDQATTTISGLSAGTSFVKVNYSVNSVAADPDGAVIHVVNPSIVVNFRKSSQTGLNGIVNTLYQWDSSSGNLADISSCDVREVVTYDPNPFPSPPYVRVNLANPTYGSVNASDGRVPDQQINPGFIKPYQPNSFNAYQKFQFRCPYYSNGNYVDLQTGITINRQVSQNSDGTWKYVVNNSGTSATINPLP